MDHEKTGALLRRLRTDRGLTQNEVAQALCVSGQAVSKWERGLGCPDVSLLKSLSAFFGVPVEVFLSGELQENGRIGGNMKKTLFAVCPSCGNLITLSGAAAVSCCGKTLEPLTAQKCDDAHRLQIEMVEDERFVTASHPMQKEHHIAIAALTTAERITLVRCYPEWDLQLRLPRQHGVLYWYCTRHGLFYQNL